MISSFSAALSEVGEEDDDEDDDEDKSYLLTESDMLICQC
jgi:hypothetical protein